jgi:hypothetical protein
MRFRKTLSGENFTYGGRGIALKAAFSQLCNMSESEIAEKVDFLSLCNPKSRFSLKKENIN